MARLTVAEWLEILHADGVAVVDPDTAIDVEKLMIAWGVEHADGDSISREDLTKVGLADAADVFAARLATTPEQYAAIRRHFFRCFAPKSREGSWESWTSGVGPEPSISREAQRGGCHRGERGWSLAALVLTVGGAALWALLATLGFDCSGHNEIRGGNESVSGYVDASTGGDDQIFGDLNSVTEGDRGAFDDLGLGSGGSYEYSTFGDKVSDAQGDDREFNNENSTTRSGTSGDRESGAGDGDITSGGTDSSVEENIRHIEWIVEDHIVETKPEREVEFEEELSIWSVDRYFSLILWPGLVAFALLTLGLHWLRIRAVVDQIVHQQRQQGMERRKKGRERDGAGFGEPYHFRSPPPMELTAIDAAADRLGRPHEHEEGAYLDVSRTIEGTVRAGGSPDLRFTRTKRQVPLLILVDVEEYGGREQTHPLAHAAEWILVRWKRTGLRYERYDYTGIPDKLRRPGSTRELPLDALARRHGGARLLVWSRMRYPFDIQHRMGWLSLLARWPRRAWIDLDPRVVISENHDSDGRDDAGIERVAMVESGGLMRYPFSSQGLLAAVRHIDGRGDVPLPVKDEPRPMDTRALDAALALWAAAASCVPDPTWKHLDSLRSLLPEVRRVIPDVRGVLWLMRWLDDRGLLTLPPVEARHRLALTDDAENHLLGRETQEIEVDGEIHDLELWVRRCLSDQLRSAKTLTQNDVWSKRARLAFQQCADDLRGCRVALESLLGTPADGLSRHLLTRLERRLDGSGMPRLDEKEQRTAAYGVRGALGGRVWPRKLLDRPSGRDLLVGGVLASLLVVVVGMVRSGVETTVRMQAAEFDVIRVRLPRANAASYSDRDSLNASDFLPVAEVVALDLPSGARPMRLLKVPAGIFWMGSQEKEIERDSDEQSRLVRLSQGFLMCETEVTQAQWEAVMGHNPSDCRYGCGDDLPVNSVSWSMAAEYLNAMSLGEGVEPCYEKNPGGWVWNTGCDGYRLPTEAEWEYATRAWTETAYSFGSDTSQLEQYAWFRANSGDDAPQVAKKGPNPWGLYDMHGSVWEWVWDWYGPVYAAQDQNDPIGPAVGEERVLRGGSFADSARWLRSPDRFKSDPAFVSRIFGLRCARGFVRSNNDGNSDR